MFTVNVSHLEYVTWKIHHEYMGSPAWDYVFWYRKQPGILNADFVQSPEGPTVMRLIFESEQQYHWFLLHQ